MNLRNFDHPSTPPPNNSRRPKRDKFNQYSDWFSCDLLECIGWYDQSVSHRLLGHYRLFQPFKRYHQKQGRMLPLVRAYVANYKKNYRTPYKNLFARLCSSWFIFILHFSYSKLVRGWIKMNEETATYNDLLISDDGFELLEEFLFLAETDFDQALMHARARLSDPAFFRTRSGTIRMIPQPVLVQHNYEYNSHQQNNYIHHELNIHPIVKEGAKGKEKGVFSKKQILIFFDLLSTTAHLEKIDLSRPNKFDAIATLMHAITGKSKDSFIEELNDYKNKDLYAANSHGELNELINTLTNLSELFRNAGFKSVAKLANTKIRELEIKRDFNPPT